MEDGRKMLRRIVTSVRDESGGWPTGEDGRPLEEVVTWFRGKLDQIPVEFRSSAVCNISRRYYEEDVAYAQIEIFYFSPASDREVSFEDHLARKRAIYERSLARKKLRDITEQFPDLPDSDE